MELSPQVCKKLGKERPRWCWHILKNGKILPAPLCLSFAPHTIKNIKFPYENGFWYWCVLKLLACGVFLLWWFVGDLGVW